MSGAASRFQGRPGYAPGMRAGVYPVGANRQAPGAAEQEQVVAPSPVPVAAGLAGAAQGGAPGVMAGSLRPDRQPFEPDGAGGSAQGDYGGAGPSGIESTGSALGDLAGFGDVAGRAALGMMNPAGLIGTVGGVMASGLAAALGAPETAAGIARGIGLGPPAPYSYEGQPLGAYGGLKGPENAPGLVTSETPLSGDGAGFGGAPADNPNSNSEAGAQDAAGAQESGFGGGAAGLGDQAGFGEFMRGGYTGAGSDGVVQATQPAGTVHEGEVVLPAHAVARYGLTPLMLLARGQVEPSRLSALLRG